MKMNNTIYRSIPKSFGLLALLFTLFFSGCNLLQFGLGDKVDLAGPTLLIESPGYMENVSSQFRISGTLEDDYAVKSLEITVDGVEQQWRNLYGQWQISSDGSTWENSSQGNWQDNEGLIRWWIDVTLDLSGNNEYVISAISYDETGNSDSNSFSQVMVVYDNTPPNLKVINPVMKVGTYSEAAAQMDNYNLKDSSLMDLLYNGDVLFRWSIEDQFTIGDLVLELSDQAGRSYYRDTLESVDRNGSFSIPKDQILDPATGLPLTDKTYLQLITTSYDIAGNFESKSNGWFCYWPDANTPWAEYSLSKDTGTPTSIYPGFKIQGQAYDDDSVKSVTIKVYQGLGLGGTLLSGYPLTLENPKNTSSFNWSVSSPMDNGNYTLEITVLDEQQSVSSAALGYFFVEDISLPRIYINSPDQNSTLFGNSDGDFSFNGTVDDDSAVSSLRILWIKPDGSDPAAAQLTYMDKSYSGWSSTSYPDSTADRILWDIPLGSSSINSNGRNEYSFSLNLNLFTDLGIGSTRLLSNQLFMLRVEDNNGKAFIMPYTTSGDMEEPVLSLEKVIVTHSGTTSTEYDISSELILPAFQAGDVLSFKGSWSDNSFDVWANVARMGDFDISLNGTVFSASLDPNGSWTSSRTNPPGGASLAVEALLKDWAGNQANAIAGFYVESDLPEFLSINSPQSDGYYRWGETIQISLNFNKNVTFSGGTDNPVLTLNNGALVNYSSGNGTAHHLFNYTVGSSDNIMDLDVSSINLNGQSWRDPSDVEVNMALPSGVFSLAGSKNLVIDNQVPRLSSLEGITDSGAFKEGDVIYMAVNFSEKMILSGGNPRLELYSSGSGIYADFENSTSSSRMLFSYTVSNGHNASPLSIASFDLNGATLVDMAGNNCDLALPAGGLDTAYLIDTTRPAAPIITGPASGKRYSNVTFSVTGAESNLHYSVDDGSTWLGYTSPVVLDTNGTYRVTARQIDDAGNISPDAATMEFTLDIGNVLNRISSSTIDGYYSDSDHIDLVCYFRIPVTVTGSPKLILNTVPPTEAVYSSGSGSGELHFSYNVGNSESVDLLDVDSFDWSSATVTDGSGNDISSYIAMADAGMTLADQKTFSIVNGIPEVQSIDYTGNTLTIDFDRDIFKNSGSVVLSQIQSDYLVPVVLSESEYDEIYNAADATGKAYMAANYKWGTNGAASDGTSDLDGKYILDFSLDSGDSGMVNHFITAGAHQIEVPVASSVVSISGSQMLIQLSGSYELPVMGAEYILIISPNLVTDMLGNSNVLLDTSSSSTDSFDNIRAEGIEKPVIRIDKQSETLALDGSSIVRAAQPLTAAVRMDCQTPGVSIYYEMESLSFNPINNDPNDGTANLTPEPVMGALPVIPAEPTILSSLYSGTFNLGDGSDYETGYKYILRSRAFKNTAGSDSSYESAFRSVFIFDNDAGTGIRDCDGGALEDQLWLRGGDAVSGSTLISGFPLSWNQEDYSGIRLLSNDSNDTDIWYWVSWEINATAYVGILAGSTPGNLSDAQSNGPTAWTWGKNAWVPFKTYYPIFPGESRIQYTSLDATVAGQPRGGFDFQGTIFSR